MADGPRFPTGSRRIKLLVVDDDEHIISMVSRMLRRDAEITAVRSGEEALAQIASSDFDAVLFDMALAGTSGRAVWEAIRRDAPELAERIMFMSGGAITAEEQAFLEVLTERLVAKPFRRDELLAVLRRFARH